LGEDVDAGDELSISAKTTLVIGSTIVKPDIAQ